MFYLDAASTAPHNELNNIVIETMSKAMKEDWENPSSLYASKVKEKIDNCRKAIAEFIYAKPEEIFFTSGGSESNSWALQGFVKECYMNGKQPIIVTTPIEHKSIMNCIETLDAEVWMVAVDDDGLLKMDMFEKALQDVNKYCMAHFNDFEVLVSIQLANNEIGTEQDMREISKIIHNNGALLHTDAVQVFGNLDIDVDVIGADMMSVSGHKIAPALRGIGFLYKRSGVNIQPIIYGNQEEGLRGGTENTYGIIGLAKALEYKGSIKVKYSDTIAYQKRQYFIKRLQEEFGCKLNGYSKLRLSNNINVTFPQNITGEALLHTLNASGIKISTGSACNSQSIEPSYVLKAIGLTDEEAMRTVRITFANDITLEDIDKIIKEIDSAIKIITEV